jgi:predicted nucleotidyltransferase
MLIEKILGSKSKIKVLRLFHENARREFTLYELGKEFGLSAGTMSPVLKSLSDSRALLSRRVGNSVVYQLNPRNLIVKKTLEIFDSERKMLSEKAEEFARKLGKPGILSIILFGSVATGKSTESSDIDIMVVHEGGRAGVEGRVNGLAEEFLDEEVLISPVVLSKKEAAGMLKRYDSFILRVQEEGRVLYGKPLGRMAHG